MSPKPKLFGVFIGINEYAGNVSNLKGCINDIKAYKETVLDCYRDEIEIDFESNIQALYDSEATYQNVIDAFDPNNFQNIQKQDVFLFIYAGHGSRERQAKEFDSIYPEGFSETLVLHDSRVGEQSKDLADKEIAILLHRIGKLCDNITVVFDCCHSGSGTRNFDDFKYGNARQVEQDEFNSIGRNAYPSGQRKYESYLNGYFADLFSEHPMVPKTKHILLAACDEKEKAQELNNPKNGAFTKYLTASIKANPKLSYVSIFDSCRNEMWNNGHFQNPRINDFNYFNAHGSFLLNEAIENISHIVSFDISGSLKIDIGAMQGLQFEREILLAIYNEDGFLCNARIAAVFPNYSLVEPDLEIAAGQLKAIFLSPFKSPILIANHSDKIGEGKLKSAIEIYQPVNFKIVARNSVSKYGVKIHKGIYQIIDLDKNLVLANYKGEDETEIFNEIFRDLESISQWENKITIQSKNLDFDQEEVELIFTNIHSGKQFINQELVEIELEENENGDFVFEYSIEIKNRTKKQIYCSLLYFSPAFGIEKWADNLAIPSSNKKFKIELKNGMNFLGVPPSKVETCDVFKLFISTDEYIESHWLEQAELQSVLQTSKSGIWNPRGSAREVMAFSKYSNQWFTKKVVVKSVKKKASFGKTKISINEHVEITASKDLKGDVYQRVIEGNNRSLDEYKVIKQFVNSINEAEFISLDSKENASGTINCLEFKNLQNQELLLNDPMILSLSNLDANEEDLALPITFDGEHFIPLDLQYPENGQFKFKINHLPASSANRSLKQAVKLFFVKIKAGKQHKGTHQLKLIDFERNFKIDEILEIKNKLENCQKPLLLIHGIIGNTKKMLELGKEVYYSKKYDAVLTFNYENLNTPIDTTAGELLDYLKLVGIGKNKKVSILAHSMGGLVSRSLIEQMNGKDLVEKLVLVGTPNLGSKFAGLGSKYLVQWLPVIFYFINVLKDFSAVKKVFALALGKYKADQTLNQMTWEHPDRWLKNLQNSNDPNVPYSVVYGNLEKYLEQNEEGRRLMNKVYKLGGKLFYPAPQKSDLVVSEQSMIGVPENRNPQTVITEVASIHTSYFVDEESLSEIMKLL